MDKSDKKSFGRVMTLGLLDLVITVKKEDWGYRHLVPYFALFYFIGVVVSKRKYD